MKLETVVKHMMEDPEQSVAYRMSWREEGDFISIDESGRLIRHKSSTLERFTPYLYSPTVIDIVAKDWTWER